MPSLSFGLLCALMAMLWVAGGASRGDVVAQVVARAAAATTLAAALLFAPPPALRRERPVLLLLTAAVALALVQLAPLPPAMWQALPGRAAMAGAAEVIGEAQPWRPWSIVPGATINAACSLIVPLAVLVLAGSLSDRERTWLPGLLLCLVTAATLLGLLQFSGAGFGNPLINDKPGEVSGPFANRNHFALFLAFGCLLAPSWIFLPGGRPERRGPLGIGLATLFALTILATGSRAGMVLGVLGLAIGIGLSRRGLARELSRRPRWVSSALIAGVVGIVVVLALLSVAAGRAVSIDRALAIDPGQDMRSRGLPTVLAMIRSYFPWGSGLGGFDPVFRMNEPFALLKPGYFNHAHNDFLEIALDAGVPGLLLLGAGLTWWVRTSIRAWRAGPNARDTAPKLGSAVLLLITVASLFDYPARTPLIMAVLVIAAVCLCGHAQVRQVSALPETGGHL